jgi:cystathionine beta-lyase
VWTAKELKWIVDICRRHDVTIVSDEIHCDFTYEGFTHTPILKVCPDYADHIVMCTAPSKTFNLAGLQASNIFIPDEGMRNAFKREMAGTGYSQLNTFGIKACTVAYNEGEEWLDELKTYLKGNLDFLREFISRELPEIKLTEPEGTYLVWLDMSGLGLTKTELNDLVINKAKLWLDAGHIFSPRCDQFQRVVIACPRRTLEEALVRLRDAVRG